VSRTPSLPPDRAPWLHSLVDEHIRTVGPGLVTVCATPNGVASYLVTGGDGFELRHEQGQIVTRTVTDDYGTLLAVIGGPTVVEVALHADDTQRDAYRVAVAEVDAENREQALAAVQAAAVGMLRELGVQLQEERDTEQEPDPVKTDVSTELFDGAGARRRRELGIDGTPGDAQDVPHEAFTDGGQWRCCIVCGLNTTADVHEEQA
jgi:hypothetical protein